MADYLSAITPATDLSVDDTQTWSNGTSLDTGDLRRKFNFGNQVSELAISQDPFFRFVSKVSKSPTDDPSFKFTEKRNSWHKRYAYVSNHGTTAPAALAGTEASVTHGDVDAGDVYYFCMIGDYNSSGNIQNVYGRGALGSEISPGDSGTQPSFFLQDQILKIPYMTGVTAASWDDSSATAASTASDYLLAKITNVDTSSVSNAAILTTTIIRKGSGTSTFELASYSAYNNALDAVDVSGFSVASYLEPKRCYVVGTGHDEGSGYPETWKDQPYSTGFGLTQIWKTSMAMTNTARATVLKYEPNEWARVWKEKLVEHKWDVEQSLLFGSQGTVGTTQYTQGAVDFITGYGNAFTLAIATKTADDFLDDMSNFLDPRYNNANATVFFCNTAVYNWLHKLGGYFSNNLNVNSNFSADLAVTGRKKVLGLDTTTINTVYGDMNVVRNIHLDGTNVQMLGINMKHAKYRPLVGNGVNRDTSVYVGVQTLENSGVDRRVDLILTEAGMEWSMPETHAVWTA